MKAKVITIENLSDELKGKVNQRSLKFNKEFDVQYESYNVESLKLSILNEHVDRFIGFFESKGCKVVNVEPIYRISDYTYVQRMGTYRISADTDGILHMIERYKKDYNLDFDPEFQRGYRWSHSQKIAFIEYLLSGGPSGREIYFNYPRWMGTSSLNDVMTLVDGKQRISTVMSYIKGEFSVFENIFYKDLRLEDASRIFLYFNVNDLTEMKDIVTWYLSMNTGGSVHTEEDLQKAKDILNKFKNS